MVAPNVTLTMTKQQFDVLLYGMLHERDLINDHREQEEETPEETFQIDEFTAITEIIWQGAETCEAHGLPFAGVNLSISQD